MSSSALYLYKMLKESNFTFKKLKHVDLRDIRLDEKDEVLTTSLPKLMKLHCETITSVRLRGNYLGDKGMIYVVNGLLKLKNLKVLELKENYLSSLGIQFFANNFIGSSHQGSSKTKLQKLALSGNHFGDSGIVYLCQHLMSLKNLTHLYIQNTNLTDKGMKVLSDCCVKMNVLKDVWVNNNNIGDSGLTLFLSHLFPSDHKELYLSNMNLTFSCAPSIASTLTSHSLSHLSLSGNPLLGTQFPSSLLSSLTSATPPLKTLSLSRTGLTSSPNLKSLATLLSTHLTSLTDLDVSHNSLTDPGAQIILSSLPQSLKKLNMAHTHITEVSISFLCLRKGTHLNLKSLRLEGNTLSKDSIGSLKKWVRNTTSSVQNLAIYDRTEEKDVGGGGSFSEQQGTATWLREQQKEITKIIRARVKHLRLLERQKKKKRKSPIPNSSSTPPPNRNSNRNSNSNSQKKGKREEKEKQKNTPHPPSKKKSIFSIFSSSKTSNITTTEKHEEELIRLRKHNIRSKNKISQLKRKNERLEALLHEKDSIVLKDYSGELQGLEAENGRLRSKMAEMRVKVEKVEREAEERVKSVKREAEERIKAKEEEIGQLKAAISSIMGGEHT